MQFDDVIDYLVAMVGLELQPINSSNDPLVITSVDREKRRYTVEKTSNTGKKSRAFSELEKIWNVLIQQGFVNVEQALNGSGSSRNQPETILANLPVIEHFKYNKVKHLYLRNGDTHTPGTLKELSVSESRELKKKIDHYRDFDIGQFHGEHSRIINNLKASLKNTFVKYPGEADVKTITAALTDLEQLQDKLAVSVVVLDSENFVEDDQSMSGRNYEEDEIDEVYEVYEGKSADKKVEQQYLVATRISQITPTISLLYDRIHHNEIDMQPEYQRNERIWSLKDRARLIESILLGLPIPVFYFAEKNKPDSEESYWIVIDGLQRTTTLYDFMAGEFKLQHLERRFDLNGKSFEGLSRIEQRRIREYQIHGHLIQISDDSDEMVRELFQRINTSGKNLSYQEIRSALYPGSTNQFLKHVAKSTEFQNATTLKINPDRMLDLEFILRALSYIYLGYENFDYKKYDDFLCQTLRELNEFTFVSKIDDSAPIFIELERRLFRAFAVISEIFGNGAYSKEPTGKLNKSLFELKVAVFALMSDEQLAIVRRPEIAEKLRATLFTMIRIDDTRYADWISEIFTEQNRGFDYAISNSTGKFVTINYRFNSFINMLNQVSDIGFKFKPLKGVFHDK